MGSSNLRQLVSRVQRPRCYSAYPVRAAASPARHPVFFKLFFSLAVARGDEGRWEDALDFLQRARQLEAALPANSTPTLYRVFVLRLVPHMLGELGRVDE